MYLNALKKKELNVFSYLKKKISGFFLLLLLVVFPSFFFLFLWGRGGWGGEEACFQVAFLSTIFKSQVSIMPKIYFLRFGHTVCFLLGKVKQKRKSFFVFPSPLKCSSIKNSISEDHSAQWLVLVIKITSLKNRRYKIHH